jgi:hypothetical protein
MTEEEILQASINKRFAIAFDTLKKNNSFSNQGEFCASISMNEGNFQKYYRGERKINPVILVKLNQKYNISLQWLLAGEGPMFQKEKEGNAPLSKRVKRTAGKKEPDIFAGIIQENKRPTGLPLLVTVDDTLKEVITLVPVKAQAGYLRGFADEDFISHLPAFALPGLRNGHFRAFEVAGFSMLKQEGGGLHPSDISVGQYVENLPDIRDSRVYIIVWEDGVHIKRVLNRIASDGKLILKSDNTNGQYPDIIVEQHQVHEVWEFKRNITTQLPPPTNFYKEINDLRAQVTFLREEYKKNNRALSQLSNAVQHLLAPEP